MPSVKISPPTNATNGCTKSVVEVRPSSTASATANAAPLDTPIRLGSASGLRKMPCSAAPETPSPAPTSAARTMRGTRITQTTASSAAVYSTPISMPSLPSRIAAIRSTPTSNAPNARLASMQPSSSVTRKTHDSEPRMRGSATA